MAATLTITVTANDYFEFAPTPGRAKGDTSPKAKLDGNNITFLYNDGRPMYQSIPYDTISIVSGETTFDDWDNAHEVMDKLKELGM